MTNICYQLSSYLFSLIVFNIIPIGILTSIIEEKHFSLPNDCMQLKTESICDCESNEADESLHISCLHNQMNETSINIRKEFYGSIYIYIECFQLTKKDFDYVPYLDFGFNLTFKYVKIRNCSLFESNSNVFEKFHIIQNKLEYNNSLNDFPLNGLQNFLQHFEIIEIDRLPNNANIPDNLFEPLRNIRKFYIFYNDLTNLPTGIFRNQQKLLTLDLTGNKLRNLTKNTFEGLSNLEDLDLSQNGIEVLKKDLFEFLPMLSCIYLDKNKLRELPKELFLHNRNLGVFSLRNNYDVLRALPFGLLSNFPKLKTIYLNCYLETITADVFKNSTMIDLIDLTNNQLTTLDENIFQDQENLETLNLSNNRLIILPENLFRNKTKIRELILFKNLLSSLPEKLFHDQENLKKLDLSNNRLTDLPENFFKNNHKLEMLKLFDNQLKEININIFESLQNLKTLYLFNNHLETIDVHAFKGLISLKTLELQNNNITFNSEEISTSFFYFFPTLEVLNLRNNSLMDALIPRDSSYFPLQVLDLSYNNISKVEQKHLQYVSNGQLIVNLTHNQISSIDFESMNALHERKINPQLTLDLNNNPLNCDCKLLRFVQFLSATYANNLARNIIILADNLTCHKPENLRNRSALQLSPMELLCPMDHEGCPLNCACLNRTFDLNLIVDCSQRNMNSIPEMPSAKVFHHRGIELNMSNNYLYQLPPNNRIGYTEITKLILAGNQFQEINIENLPTNLTELDLSFNQLKLLNEELLTNFTKSSTLKTLKLSGNPWHCDCQASKFLQFVLSNYGKFIDLMNMRCSEPFKGRALYKLSNSDICPTDQTVIWLSSILAVLFFFITLLSICYQRYEIEIKIWLYARNMCLWFVNEEELDRDKLYDAFISYSSKDEDFVAHYLVPNLENGTPAFKTCVHYRDFRVGQNIGQNIAYAVENSRRTIVLLSKNFLDSNWAREEFRTAHVLALEERKPKVIVILFGNIGNIDDLEPELKAYLKTNTYLTANDPWFWDRLRYAMPHSTIRRNVLNENYIANNYTLRNELQLFNSAPTNFAINSNSRETDV